MSVLLREAIGGSIRRARTERNRTLRDVSHSARVSLGYLSEIERGRKEPSSELLAAICEALALPLPDLLDEVADSLRPAPARRPRPLAVLDPALRSAVEEAFEPLAGEVEPADGADDPEGDPAPDDDGAPAASLVAAGGAVGADEAEGTDDSALDDAVVAAPGAPVTVPVVVVGLSSSRLRVAA